MSDFQESRPRPTAAQQALHSWQLVQAQPMTRQRLILFHSAHKYLLLAHDPSAYRELGRLVAVPQAFSSDDAWGSAYGARFAQAMQQPASIGRHVNVLEHIAGYFRDRLARHRRQQLATAIAAYADGQLPLEAPIELLRAAAMETRDQYLLNQAYLDAARPDCGPPVGDAPWR